MIIRHKPLIGNYSKFNYAILLEDTPLNSPIFKMDDLKRIRKFTEEAKVTHIDAKGKPTLPAVKKFIKEMKPIEYYAKWQADSSYYKDDSVEFFYKSEEDYDR